MNENDLYGGSSRMCQRCNGTGETRDILNKDAMRQCRRCAGGKLFPAINLRDVMDRILAKQGKNKGKLRASMVSPFPGTLEEQRAYFVWRLARFHGGRDMTMPIMAETSVDGDPFHKELDQIASVVARIFFRTDRAALMMWGKAFGLPVETAL